LDSKTMELPKTERSRANRDYREGIGRWGSKVTKPHSRGISRVCFWELFHTVVNLTNNSVLYLSKVLRVSIKCFHHKKISSWYVD
jgi:hypothetical protein